MLPAASTVVRKRADELLAFLAGCQIKSGWASADCLQDGILPAM
jgi:hypothetical protein